MRSVLGNLRSLRIVPTVVPVIVALLSISALLSIPATAQDNVIDSHGISTFGDLKYDADFPHFDYVNPNAAKSGEISFWAYGTFDSMNPYAAKGRAGSLSSSAFESLLEGNADEVSATYGLLAESLEYPEDRTWVIFNLRPEARFSDGSPLTTDDVNFSYELLLNQGLPSFRSELAKAVDTVEIMGPHRIKFTFKTDEPTRDYPALVGGLPIFSKKWYEESEARLDESRLETGIGSGPYVLKTLDINSRLVYERNPDYWGYHLPINQGRHNFERIRIEYFADVNAAFEAFKSGVYTFRQENQSKLWATSYEFPAIENGWVIKKTLPDGSIASGQSFVFNLRLDRFQDVRVREAIGQMFNFEWTNETLFYGLYERIDSFWENSYLEATDTPGEAELALLEPLRDKLPEIVFTEPAVMSAESGDRALDRRNLRTAIALLDDAGWIVGDDGLRRNADGEVLKIEFLTVSPSFDRIINPYVENLTQLGIEATLSRIDVAQFIQRVRDHNFDVITDSFGFDFEPGSGLRQYLGSEYMDDEFNVSGLNNEAVDQLINHVLEAETSEELNIAVTALDRVLRALKIVVFQWYRDFHTIAYFDMFEHPETIPPYALGAMDFWWHNPDKEQALIDAGVF